MTVFCSTTRPSTETTLRLPIVEEVQLPRGNFQLPVNVKRELSFFKLLYSDLHRKGFKALMYRVGLDHVNKFYTSSVTWTENVLKFLYTQWVVCVVLTEISANVINKHFKSYMILLFIDFFLSKLSNLSFILYFH